MKLIIAGGRKYRLTENDRSYKLGSIAGITEVVSGAASGADRDGEQWAKERGIPIKKFPADWDSLGRAAGPIRNGAMAEYADAVALFPGGDGTDDMYRKADKAGLKIFDWRTFVKVSTISVSYQRKFNLGDYNSLGLEATIWADLEEGDDPQAVMLRLQDQVRESVKREFARLPKPGPGVQQASKAQIAEPALT